MRELSLREQLRVAVEQRERMIRRGWSRRKDHDRVNDALRKAHNFLSSYPHANDLRVRGWCMENHAAVAILVPGNTPTALARLVMHALAPSDQPTAKENAA